MNNNYSVMVFDLGNVLIPFDYDIIKTQLEKVEEGLGEKFLKLYAENYHLHRQYEKFEITTEEFVSTMTGWLDNKISGEEFCRIYSSLFTVNEKMVELLPKLKMNYRLVLLSNTNYIHQKYGWAGYDFIKHFDKLVLSHEAGAIKPEEKIYKAVEEFTKEPPANHFYTDDVEAYINGAKKSGWDAALFTGYDDYVNELKIRGIEF